MFRNDYFLQKAAVYSPISVNRSVLITEERSVLCLLWQDFPCFCSVVEQIMSWYRNFTLHRMFFMCSTVLLKLTSTFRFIKISPKKNTHTQNWAWSTQIFSLAAYAKKPTSQHITFVTAPHSNLQSAYLYLKDERAQQTSKCLFRSVKCSACLYTPCSFFFFLSSSFLPSSSSFFYFLLVFLVSELYPALYDGFFNHSNKLQINE